MASPAAEADFSVRRVRSVVHRFSTVPAVVWALTGTLFLLSVGWSFLTPLATAPDEYAHADLAFHLSTGAPYPQWDDRFMGAAVLQTADIHRPGVRVF